MPEATVPNQTLHLASTTEANDLLARDPLALLVGLLLDQQVPMEWAFGGPYTLAERLHADLLDPVAIAAYDPEEFARLAAQRPAIHRFPGSMARRIQSLAQHITADYDGDAAAIWTGVDDGSELLGRLKALPGFGEQKAKIFL